MVKNDIFLPKNTKYCNLDPPVFRKSPFYVFPDNLGHNIVDYTTYLAKKYKPQVFENQFILHKDKSTLVVYPCADLGLWIFGSEDMLP